MMGHTHALSGSVTWLAVTPALAAAGYPLGPLELGTSVLVATGAALLPDMDHPDATVAQTYGPPSAGLAWVTNKISGGHRHATHSVLFAAAAGVGAQALAYHTEIAALVAIVLMIGLGMRGLGFGVPSKRNTSALLNALAMVAIGFGLHYAGIAQWWLGPVLFVGCLTHLAGDSITTAGCPLLWPWSQRMSLPLIPRTGGPIERWVVTPVLMVGLGALAVLQLPGRFLGDLLHLVRG